MEVKHLCYIGNKKEGSLVVKIAHPNSPFRNLKYQKGMRLRIGVEIPENITEFLASDYKNLFKIESKKVDVNGVFKDEFLVLICNYENDLDLDRIKSLVKAVLKERGTTTKEVKSQRKLGRK
jgi:hypothetical protein